MTWAELVLQLAGTVFHPLNMRLWLVSAGSKLSAHMIQSAVLNRENPILIKITIF